MTVRLILICLSMLVSVAGNAGTNCPNSSGSSLSAAELQKAVEEHGKWLDSIDVHDAGPLAYFKLGVALFFSKKTQGRANFCRLNLRNVQLPSADLIAAVFTEADLRGANLSKALLASADFTSACLQDADMSGSVLDNAKLENADIGNEIGRAHV